jgi:thiamine-phosphate pyrophosphorylase
LESLKYAVSSVLSLTEMLRYYVTDRRRGDVFASVRQAVEDGVDLIQIREKDLEARTLLTLVSKILEMTEDTPTRVLVNDRLDVALASGADGLHLPSDGLPLAVVRGLIGLVGVSTHTLEEVRSADSGGADFIVFGPVFDTPGKAAVGLDRLREVTKVTRIPVLAIGGITNENTEQVIRAGAAGIAAIRLFQGPG